MPIGIAERSATIAGMALLQTHELRITLTEDDRPEDRFSQHVNNARYFTFINRTFQGWYRAMGLRGQHPSFGAMMARCEYDFLRQVLVPGEVLCRIDVVGHGRTSLEHTVRIWDLGASEPVLAGRGRVVHVGIDRATHRPTPWPADVLAKCWDSADPSGPTAPRSTDPTGER